MKEIQIIDVTLRDGGHMVDFDWPMEFAQEYYSLMTRLRGVELVELGYWKQTEKSENPFYNLNQDVVEELWNLSIQSFH
jgi:isopropylmalate/homocitrate/citramalate synthase